MHYLKFAACWNAATEGFARVGLAGVGAGLVALVGNQGDFAEGRLVSVLEEYAAADDPVYAVVTQRKFMPSRVRLLSIFFVASMHAKVTGIHIFDLRDHMRKIPILQNNHMK